MAETNIIPFDFESQEIRAVDCDGEPWFVLLDVCRILGISNASDAASRLDADEKAAIGITDISSTGVTQQRSVSIVNESGLYSLTLTSRKPEAKRFKKWITSEVIPSLRKTGKYQLPSQQPTHFDAIRALVNAAEEQEKRLKKVEGAVENFGAHEDYRSIKAHAALVGARITTKQSGELGRAASALSRQTGHKICSQPDESYGKVNTYHREVLEEVFKSIAHPQQ